MRRSAAIRWVWFALAFAGLGGSVAATLRAEDKLWIGLVIADNSTKEGTVRVGNRWPAALTGREKQLQKIFGYRHFQLVGQAQGLIKTGEEDWLVPSNQFYLKVDAKRPIPEGYLINLQLWQGTKQLVETDVKLSRTTPLYIRGPQVGEGQLIIALVCGGKEAAWTKAKPKLAGAPVPPAGAPTVEGKPTASPATPASN